MEKNNKRKRAGRSSSVGRTCAPHDPGEIRVHNPLRPCPLLHLVGSSLDPSLHAPSWRNNAEVAIVVDVSGKSAFGE